MADLQSGNREPELPAPAAEIPKPELPALPAETPKHEVQKRRDGRRIAKELLLQFLIVIVGIIVFDPIKSWWLGPEKYTVFLVGSTGNSEIKKMFRTIQDDSALAHLKIDGKEVVVEERDDEGEPDKANKIAEDLSVRSDTLMVVGHVMTASTMKALPVYMATEPQIPLIATRETHPELLKEVTHQDCQQVYCPFMPMSPTDADQAKQAIDFAKKEGWDSFLLVRYPKRRSGGPRNAEYADNLTQGYKDEIEKHSGTLVKELDVYDGVSLDDAFGIIEKFKPKCVLFVGPVDNARVFIAALSQRIKEPKNQPALLFSDSAVDDGLLNTNMQIFATFPLPAEDFRSINSVYGDDAFALVSALIKQVEQNRKVEKQSWFHHVINMHRVKDARMAIIEVMRDDVANNLPIYRSQNRVYQYVEKYRLMNIHFHVWKIENQKITEVGDVESAPTFTTQALPISPPVTCSLYPAFCFKWNN